MKTKTGLTTVMLAMLAWGSLASANTDSAANEALEIRQRIEFLNENLTAVEVSDAQDLSKPQYRHQLLNELILLESSVAGEVNLHPGTLTLLRCPRVECDGD